MRPTAILAYASGMGQQIINSLFQVDYQPPDGQRFQHPRIRVRRAGIIQELIAQRLADDVTLPWTSAAPGGTWDVVLLVADPGARGREAVEDDGGWRWLTRAFRKLRVLAADHPTYLRGPWSLAHLVELYPAKAAELLQDGEGGWSFPLLAGDDPAGLLAVDYRPSAADIDGDVDPDPAALFGGG